MKATHRAGQSQGNLREMTQGLWMNQTQAELTVGFPVRRVHEFPSLLNQCELGFLLRATQSILNDKADALALLCIITQHHVLQGIPRISQSLTQTSAALSVSHVASSWG